MKDKSVRGVPQALAQGSLVFNVVEFCRILKTNELQIASANTGIAIAALAEIDIVSVQHFRIALRLCLLQRPEDIPAYNDIFNRYWRSHRESMPQEVPNDTPRAPQVTSHEGDDAKLTELSATIERLIENDALSNDGDRSSTDRSPVAVRGADPSPTAAEIPSNDAAALDRIGRALARALAQRRSRRQQSSRRGKHIDARKLMRNAVGYGGIPLELPWRRRLVSRARLVIFCDVSRSMDACAELLLRFAAAVLRHAWRVDVFLFANDLVRVSDRWRDEDWTSLTENIKALGGGTQIGASLESFIENYRHCLNSRHCVTIVLSDGLDAGEPEILTTALRRIKAGSRQLIWLNPLLATPGYEPIARGMAAALPFIDIFASGHNLESLRGIAALLHESPRRLHAIE